MNTKKPARDLALDLLERSPCAVQVAAVITDSSGKIFSWGWNHVVEDGAGKHAEVHAIGRANKRRLQGATITVAGRRRKSGNFLCARPCEVIQLTQRTAHASLCMDILKKHGIETIEYTTHSGVWTTLKLKYMRVK